MMKLKIAVTGALGYSGTYIAREAHSRGHQVIALTNSPHRENPLSLPIVSLAWDAPVQLEAVLRECDVLINTYWVRFNGKNLSHARALRNTQMLFTAARAAGVKRIVHTSITHPDAYSDLSYFSGKAEAEKYLRELPVPSSILRPALLFGRTPEESILINNMAWALRRFPLVGVFGDGKYRLQPLHVQDFAELALHEAERTDRENAIIEAVGPEIYSFRELWEMIGKAIGKPRKTISVPPWFGWGIARLTGMLFGDVMLTRDEVRALMENRLVVENAEPAGSRSLRVWCEHNAKNLGKDYASELSRRKT